MVRSTAVALWVLSNPSTADAETDDHTIRRVIGFTTLWGLSRAEILNRHAYCTAYPAELKAAMRRGVDVAGPENDRYFAEALERKPAVVVAAWGALETFAPIPPPIDAPWREQRMHVLGLNLNGTPKHPLRVSYMAGNRPW